MNLYRINGIIVYILRAINDYYLKNTRGASKYLEKHITRA